MFPVYILYLFHQLEPVDMDNMEKPPTVVKFSQHLAGCTKMELAAALVIWYDIFFNDERNS